MVANKKANGEGSIYKYRDGWRAQLTIGRDENGKIKRKSFTGKTKLEVKKKMEEYSSLHDKGLTSINDSISLGEWFYKWLFKYRINDLKPSTLERYEGIYRNYIKGSQIYSIKLKDLRTSHLQLYYNTLLEKDKTVSSIYTLNKVLKACLTQAYKENYIAKNWCTTVILPKKEINEDKYEDIKVFTVDEQERFTRIALESHRLGFLFVFNLGTGLRIGELLALRWSDIHKENNIINITKALKETYIIDDKGNRTYTLLEQTPKTKDSIRQVPLPKDLFTLLDLHYKRQLEEIIKHGEVYVKNDLVFCTPIGTPLSIGNIRKVFKRILERNNFNTLRIHDLRHTYATRLFEVGIPPKTVQKLLGHANMSTTMNIYTHVTKDTQIDAVEKINFLFKKSMV